MTKEYSNITTVEILDLNKERIDDRVVMSATFSRKLDMPKIIDFLKHLVLNENILTVKEFEAFVKCDKFKDIALYLDTSSILKQYVPIGENKFISIRLGYSQKFAWHSDKFHALNDEEKAVLNKMNSLVTELH